MNLIDFKSANTEFSRPKTLAKSFYSIFNKCTFFYFRAGGRTDGRADGQTDGRADGQTDGRVDGRMD